MKSPRKTIGLLAVIITLIISACATGSGPRWLWEVQWVDRQEGTYGNWTTSHNSNEFDVWTRSRVLGSKGGQFSNQSYIHVQSSQGEDAFVGINIGDGFICGDEILVKMAWEDSQGGKKIETTYLSTSTNNELLLFSYKRAEKYRFLHMLNLYDKLAIQTVDKCGENTIVRFNIEGTHHMTTTETNPEGHSYTIKSKVS